jgi:hypothetical protein
MTTHLEEINKIIECFKDMTLILKGRDKTDWKNYKQQELLQAKELLK